MPKRLHDPDEPHRPTEEEFEKLVAATLEVDPKGLSGKHRRQVTRDRYLSAACQSEEHGGCDRRVVVPCECLCHGERDERVSIHAPAEEAMAAIMDTGPHPEEEWEDAPGESRP